MNFKAIAMVALSVVAMTACSDDDNGPGSPPARIRVVNSLFKLNTAGNTATGIAVDFMVDSATTTGVSSSTDVLPATFDDIPANSISNVTSAGVATNAGFEEFDVGVHSYVVREADSVSGRMSQLYTQSASLPYLPKQYLTSNTYYTWLIAGLIPVAGTNPILMPSTAVPFSAIVDDPFPPPTLSDGTYQSRFRVYNVAPFVAAANSTGAGASVNVFLTTGLTAPSAATLATLSPLTTAAFRNSSAAYINTTAGPYTLSLSTGTAGSTQTILNQTAITFAPGEVRTFVLQNSMASTAIPTTATSFSIKLTNILDQDF